MKLSELIVKLVALEDQHGSDINVLVNHSDFNDESPFHIPAENGCPAYISIESE